MRFSVYSIRVVIFINLVLFGFVRVSAQTGSTRGIINDSGGNPVQFATVQLLKYPDSSLVKEMISDSLGGYHFKNITVGKYYVAISFTGMEKLFSGVFEIRTPDDQLNQGIIYLRNSNQSLKDVTVSVKRPMIEQKIDRVVINVKNSITDAGGTALDVLEKSPGVTINRQNSNIAINGKNGVSVMINGKMSYMPTDALVQFLAGVPAGNIDRIELITTPPSKYDASGNGGYINIILINNPFAGFNGSYFLTAGYGKRGLGAAGINFNYRSDKINFYGNYSFNHDSYLQPSTGFTQFTKDGNTITNNTYSNRDAIQEVQNARIGFDYQLDTSTIIGVLMSGYNSRWTMIAHNGATISQNNVLDTAIITVDDPELNLWQNVMANLNLQHTFKPRKVLFLDANYIYYKDNNPNSYSADYYDNSKEFLYHEDLRSGKITPIHFWVFSVDYTSPLGKNIAIETGAKISFSRFNNDVSVEKLNQGLWIPDSSLSANYLLKENIAAAYTSVVVNMNNNFTITAGLRYEYAASNLGTLKLADIVNRKYGELFPTIYISKKFNSENGLSLSYSRRITRPSFNDLAPFTVFFDPKTFYSGNPALQPAIANSIQGGYSYRNYNFTISFTHEINTIDNFYFQIQKVDSVSGIVYLSTRNFDYEQYLTAGFSLPFTVSSWWTMQNNLNGDWRRVSTVFGKIPLRWEYFAYNLNSTQHFSFPKDFSFEISGFYSSASYLGTAKREPYFQLDAGVQKKLVNKRDILRFSASDIFNSGGEYRFGETLPGTGAIVNRSFNFGLVAFRFTYTHNFGNNALKGKRDRSTGAEDELKRVHN